jgi:gliding motility-associated-like protein
MPGKKLLFSLLILLAFSRVAAQLCQGSLGDPIVNITFGGGTNPGPPLASTKNLQYFSPDCPNDGFYTVRTNTTQCFFNSWHTVNSDHTGNADGYFMLINASLQKSEFYVDTVRGLCPNTTYEFAAWIMNVIKPSSCGGRTIMPNLTFNIEKPDGTVVQSYSTGDIPPSSSPAWNQNGFFFTTPVGVTNVVLRISNNSTGGCGNDLGIDDITFRPCGPSLNSYFVGEPAGNVKEWCEGEDTEVALKCDVSAGYNDPYFQWQQSTDGSNTWLDIPSANTTTLSRRFPSSTAPGNYLYRMTVRQQAGVDLASCRVASGILTVRINSVPDATISSNSPVCEGGAVTLALSGGEQYKWTGVNNFSSSAKSVTINNAQLANGGKYYVTVTSVKGCVSKDSTEVIVSPVPVASVAFTRQTICKGESVFLSSSGGTAYKWFPSVGLSSSSIANPVATPAETIKYNVVVGNGSVCTDTAIVTVNVIATPIANAGPNHAIHEGQSVELNGNIIGSNYTYNWSPNIYIDSVHTLQPNVNPVSDTRYILNVTSNDGCGFSADTAFIRVYKNIVIPNAFSPNGDGINDTWNITALNTYTDFDFAVFNRYGQLVYQSKSYNQPWNGTYNGKALPAGTYYYVLNLRNALPMQKGYIVILR